MNKWSVIQIYQDWCFNMVYSIIFSRDMMSSSSNWNEGGTASFHLAFDPQLFGIIIVVVLQI